METVLIQHTYAMPKGLYEAVQENANRERKVQFVGMTSLLLSVPWEEWHIRARCGSEMKWLYGPTREEMLNKVDVILCIVPQGGDDANPS